MKIEKLTVGINQANTYIIYDTNNQEALVIDPGDEEKRIMQTIDKKYLKVKGIILTHYHHDHVGAAEALKDKYNCPIYAHKREVEGLKTPAINRSIHRGRKPISLEADILVSEGQIIEAEGFQLEIIHTPGHTPGGICLKVKNQPIIFTGDTIFIDDLGRTDLEGGNEEALKKTITNKVSKWHDDIIIYPGHGERASMKEVRQNKVPYLKP